MKRTLTKSAVLLWIILLAVGTSVHAQQTLPRAPSIAPVQNLGWDPETSKEIINGRLTGPFKPIFH